MQKIIHKLIRYSRGGVNVVADVNATIATGNDGISTASAGSYSRIVQRNGRTWTESRTEASEDKEVNHGEGHE
ncbi:MAG TPA: hypothetical protein VFR68_06940 [Candidatus Dormibacteraeota bacterium]|nr:hypothetical protein [Candidatus Dormibacteraeota bacterium]